MIAVVILGMLIAAAFPLLFINFFRKAQADQIGKAQADQIELARRIVIDLKSTAGGVRIVGSHVERIGETPTAITH
jgi:type II secretory pathway pseudopilin PulG